MYKELLLNTSWIPAIENLKNQLNLAVLIFLISHFGYYIASEK